MPWVLDYRGTHGKFRFTIWPIGREPFPIGWVRIRRTRKNEEGHTLVTLDYSTKGKSRRRTVTLVAENAREFTVREV